MVLIPASRKVGKRLAKDTFLYSRTNTKLPNPRIKAHLPKTNYQRPNPPIPQNQQSRLFTFHPISPPTQKKSRKNRDKDKAYGRIAIHPFFIQ